MTTSWKLQAHQLHALDAGQATLRTRCWPSGDIRCCAPHQQLLPNMHALRGYKTGAGCTQIAQPSQKQSKRLHIRRPPQSIRNGKDWCCNRPLGSMPARMRCWYALRYCTKKHLRLAACSADGVLTVVSSLLCCAAALAAVAANAQGER
jgi:hypothetical protein